MEVLCQTEIDLLEGYLERVEAGGLAEVDITENYLTDLTSAASVPSFDQLNDLKAMEWQYQILRSCLEQQNPWQALITEFPILQTIVSELAFYRGFQEVKLQENFLQLYDRYCVEWQGFSARHTLVRDKKRAA